MPILVVWKPPFAPRSASRPARGAAGRTRRGRGVLALVVAAGIASAASAGTSHPPIPGYVSGSERTTIEAFRSAADSVVFVTNERLQRGFRLNIEKIPQDTGSGIIWDDQGHILTNFHVIQGGNAFSITFGDGLTVPANVVGYDPNKDLAVLKVDTDSSHLAPIRRGQSGNLVVGQKVLAIGNPFGLDRTLTVGVISALGREIVSVAGTTIEDVIQTDASINPGNSGGPLLDSSGAMIGVNTQIVSRSGQSAGIGFAVPVATVERIVPQLIRYGKVRRAGLGVSILNDAYARQWGIEGVILREVAPSSPAGRAGLRSIQVDAMGRVLSYDVVTAIDGRPVKNYDDLFQALDGRKPGEQVTVTFERGGKRYQTKVRLQELD